MKLYVLSAILVFSLLGALTVVIKENAALKVEVTQTKQALDRYVHAMNQMAADQVAIVEQKQKLAEDYRIASTKLTQLKNREATVLAKKGLVELKINKAFNEQQNAIACITGATELCE